MNVVMVDMPVILCENTTQWPIHAKELNGTASKGFVLTPSPAAVEHGN